MRISILALVSICPSVVRASPTSSSVSALLPSQTATVTTLPPAQPSSNSTNPCDFADRASLLSRVVDDWQGYNISLLVDTCPSVCVLIYGDGNPDVSGIGVLISYVLQFVSTLLLGPGLLYTMRYKHRFSDRTQQLLTMVRKDIMPVVNNGNDWNTLAIVFASGIRLLTNPPVFERDFISVLLWFLLFVSLARMVSTVVLTPDAEAGGVRDRAFWQIMFGSGTLLFTWVMCLCSLGPIAASTANEALVAISRFCAFEDDLPINIKPVVSEPQDDGLTWWESILIDVVLPVVVFAVMFAIMIAFMVLWELAPDRLKDPVITSARRIKQLGIVLLIYLPGVLWIPLCVWLLAVLQGYRDALQTALGKQYQDSYWGFGQITIMILLLPSLCEAFVKMLMFHPVQEEEGDIENEAADEHELQSITRSSEDDSHSSADDSDRPESNSVSPSPGNLHDRRGGSRTF